MATIRSGSQILKEAVERFKINRKSADREFIGVNSKEKLLEQKDFAAIGRNARQTMIFNMEDRNFAKYEGKFPDYFSRCQVPILA